MKRSFTVGRNPLNDIYIDDPSNVISRSHATIRVDGRKYYITDHSTNGTYRNGIRLSPGLEYPVTKEDEISFGGLYTFDWGMLPNPKLPLKSFLVYLLSIIVLVALCVGVVFFIHKHKSFNLPENPSEMIESKIDTNEVHTPEDSISVEENDSSIPVRKDL